MSEIYNERNPLSFRFECPPGRVEEALWTLAELSHELSGPYILGQKIVGLRAIPCLMPTKSEEPIKEVIIEGACARGVDTLLAMALANKRIANFEDDVRTKIHFVDRSSIKGEGNFREGHGWTIPAWSLQGC